MFLGHPASGLGRIGFRIGSATALSRWPDVVRCSSATGETRRAHGLENDSTSYPASEFHKTFVTGFGCSTEPAEKILIRGLQQAFQKVELLVVQIVERLRQKALQEQIELLHAPPTAPAQLRAPSLPGEVVPPA